MIWRNLCLAQALVASGVLSSCLFAPARADEPNDPAPRADSTVTTVPVLEGQKSGLLNVEVRGAGQDSVRVKLTNLSGQKLRVVLPPGLVASNATGQGAGGGGGGGGFQNMGLGAAGNQAGGFGQFASSKSVGGFQSIPVDADAAASTVAVPVGQTVDFAIPAVCLNFGAPTPTSKNRFKLVDVDDYSTDVRVRKSLRTLATVGTSQGVAQAAMWRVCNEISFEEMLSRGEKVMNSAEVALATRFLKAIDSGADVAAALDSARIFVSLEGNADASKDIARLARDLDGLRVLGLPVRVLAAGEVPQAAASMIHLGVSLGSTASGESRGKVVVQVGEGIDNLDWSNLGSARFDDLATSSSLDAASLARALDEAVASTFVTAKVSKRSANGTTLEIRNRLPFTVANVTVKAGNSPNSPLIDVPTIGIGPGRTGSATIPAAMGTISRVELNGL